MRLIDADALDKRRIDYIVDGYAESVNDMTEWGMAIIEAPTIDAVEVVRCGECRHKYMKDFDMFCPYMVGIIKPNMHCSYGEREGE